MVQRFLSVLFSVAFLEPMLAHRRHLNILMKSNNRQINGILHANKFTNFILKHQKQYAIKFFKTLALTQNLKSFSLTMQGLSSLYIHFLQYILECGMGI